MYGLLNNISIKNSISLSTLKLNARISKFICQTNAFETQNSIVFKQWNSYVLRDLNLISYKIYIQLTDMGSLVMQICQSKKE